MSMLKATLALLLCVFSCFLFSQNKLYTGFEIGPKYDLYQFYSDTNDLQTKPFLNGIFGFNLGYALKNGLIIETGIYKNNFRLAYYFKTPKGFELLKHNSSLIFSSVQIPLRIKTNIKIFKDKIFLSSYIGSSVLTNSKVGYMTSSTTKAVILLNGIPQDSVIVTAVSQKLVKHPFLIECGVGFDFLLYKQIQLTIMASYYSGLSTLTKSDLVYQINDMPASTGSVLSKGDSFNIFLGIKYPISNLWGKKNQSSE